MTVINAKVGDYLGTKPIDRMLAWEYLTIDRIIEINGSEYNVEYFDSKLGIRKITYHIRENYDNMVVLSEDIPEEKFLIDRFKTLQMQYILEM